MNENWGQVNLNLHVESSQDAQYPPNQTCASMAYGTNYFGGDSSIKVDCQQNTNCPAIYGATSSGLLTGVGGIAGGIEDINGNGNNGTGRTMSYTTTTVNGYPQPPAWGAGQVASYTGISSVTLPGVSGAYTYQYLTFSRGSSLGLSASVNAYSTGGACFANFGNPPTQTTTFADVSSVVLPNGQSYTFGYDGQWGLVNFIKYPTGGTVTYTWGVNPLSVSYESYNAATPNIWNGFLLNGPQKCYFEYNLPVVTKRVVSFDGTHPALEQDFAYSTQTGTNGFWSTKTTTVTAKDLLRPGTPNTVTIYNYIPMFPPKLSTGSSSQSVIPHEDTVVYQDGAGNTLRTVKKVWLGVDLLGAECETLDNGMVSGKFYQYQQVPSPAYVWSSGMSDQVTDVAEYDYTQGVMSACVKPPSTAPARETKTQYATIPSSALWQPALSATIPQTNDRPSVIQIYDHGTLISETDIAYDETSIAAVTPAAYNHDETNFGPSQVAGRGNATTITKCLPNCSQPSVTKVQYDETGQIVAVTDPKLNTTTLSYLDNYSTGGTPPGNTNTYLTTITRPPTNGVNHVSSFAYHYTFGELTSATDENGKITTYEYNDTWGRPTLAGAPDGGQIQRRYDDSAPSPSVTTCQLINGTAGATCIATSPPIGWKTTLATMDGIGHVVQSELVSDPDGATYTSTTYDGFGRPYKVTNPYRSTGDSTYGITTQLYDALGRPCLVVPPDFAASAPTACPATPPVGDLFTSYSGNQTTVTDEVGNQRKSQRNGLGQLTFVWEAPNQTGYNYETDYVYDALGNLQSVTQKGSNSANARTRTFTYDSLSRLLCAANPEVQIATCPASGTTFPTGAITYAYDANGNLSAKTSPLPNQAGSSTVTTNYAYDALNRLTGKTYKDGTVTDPYTPPVLYGYDGVAPTGCTKAPPTLPDTYPIGRRTSMCDGSGSTSWDHDPLGRIMQDKRFIGGIAAAKFVNYGYDLAGDVAYLTTPPIKTLAYNYANAAGMTAGRPIQVLDTTDTITFATGATYAPPGELAGDLPPVFVHVRIRQLSAAPSSG